MQKRTQGQDDTEIRPRQVQPEGHIGTLRSMHMYVQLPWLMQQYPRILAFRLYNFVFGFFSIGLMATVGVHARHHPADPPGHRYHSPLWRTAPALESTCCASQRH